MSSRRGQAMLIAIVTLGGAILGATTLAGLLMLYQIRSTTDTENSAKAIFAADSGVNWALYSYFNPPEGAALTFIDSGVTASTTCYDANENVTACDNSGATAATYAIAEGASNGSRRAFWIELDTATGTLP